MSYTINHYNGTLITTVADGTIDASLDITLIGKNYAGYGKSQNENFVYLLENFANPASPPNPVSGQIWFDSGNSKLKFYDGTKFRTTGGAEVGPSTSPPSGLTQGDFWFNTTSNQLYAYNGAAFVLVGPQAVSGSGTTQMQSASVQDSSGGTHAIIKAIDDGNVIFTVSSDSVFTLDNTINPITGFTAIQQGLTLAYTNNNATPGVTTDSHRFWGTATNADRLGGIAAGSFVQAGNANFDTLVNFADVGFTIGNPVAKLKIFNDGSTTPTILNQYTDTIVFQTTVSSVTQTPLQLKGPHMLPGLSATSNIGSATLQFQNIYAGYVYATASAADALNVSNVARTASTASSPNTVAVRDSSSNISANLFQGTATAANYADLAEKYLADAEYEPGTVVMIGGEQEVTSSVWGKRAVGVVSTNPGFMMNKDLEGGTYIALKGRVPVRVSGRVNKGDELIAGNNGTAGVAVPHSSGVFAVALESSDDTGVKLVECLVL